MKSFALNNMMLVLIGLALIATGLFRQHPIKIDKPFLWNTVPMAAMFLLVIWAAYVFNKTPVSIMKEGKMVIDTRTAFERGVAGSMKTSSQFFFTIAILMPLIGFSTALTPIFQAKIVKALEGWTGWVVVFPLAVISPGGSGFSGVVLHLWKVAKQLQPLMLYFLTVTPLIAYTIFQIRALGLGTEIANKMYLMNFVSAIWLMPLYLIYGKFFFKASA